MVGGRIVLIVLAGLGFLWLIASGSSGDQVPKDAKWKVIGGTVPPGMRIKFVQMDPQYAKDRNEYDNAVNFLCPESAIVAFFLPGDRVKHQGFLRCWRMDKLPPPGDVVVRSKPGGGRIYEVGL